MIIRAGMAVLFACVLAGCAQPLVKPRPITFQDKMRTAAHWNEMASDTADKILQGLQRVPEIDPSGHILDGAAQSVTLAQRPIFVRSLDSSMPFSEAFRDLLIQQLIDRGESVSMSPAGAVVVNYDVQVLAYNHRSPFDDGYVPGDYTVASTLGYLGWQAADHWDESSLKAGLVALGPALDVLATTRKILTDAPNTEVIITTAVVDERAYLFRSSDIFYVEDADARLYANSFNVRPARPMPTGAKVPYPTPTKIVGVAAN